MAATWPDVNDILPQETDQLVTGQCNWSRELGIFEWKSTNFGRVAIILSPGRYNHTFSRCSSL